MTGSWDINISTGMPQKVATAFAELRDKLVGAEYTSIAYLGSQVVNGINHAVLAEQLLTTGKDTKNVVVVIFNEKEDKVTLSNIERVVSSGGELGSIKVDVKTKIPDKVKEALNSVLSGFVGSKIEPFAYLGTQVTKGTDYIFAGTMTPVALEAKSKVVLIKANAMTNTINFVDILNSKENSLGYAFSW